MSFLALRIIIGIVSITIGILIALVIPLKVFHKTVPQIELSHSAITSGIVTAVLCCGLILTTHLLAKVTIVKEQAYLITDTASLDSVLNATGKVEIKVEKDGKPKTFTINRSQLIVRKEKLKQTYFVVRQYQRKFSVFVDKYKGYELFLQE